MQSFAFVVNGAEIVVTVPPETPLLYALRNDLALTGTRFGCGDGLCGVCTVLVDGEPRWACQLRVWEVEAKRVETVEALIAEPRHPLVTEVLAGNAGQCGYCLSGILMQARALLDRTDGVPDRAAIATALAGNLCRCGAHGRILDAIERAARTIAEAA
ncbi:(2Fe-2S)-binding protein [Acuticoccus mangrovi]|uniref:2Fe-2S iron-sulfur cluster binding domain-containing protein n=1 Tax=Acuticoccus mangrovi TaxID=2796142 RepID=A0A934IL37_9HYPH|nr:2Fe-2S iron-sulfur cluster-binding protein [Acuticoccus mangrovi]MBJ3775787.1 2Fe-2S iron-sulfur cluster binding domain-containing protein [Acuticoccus mangrovi]